MQRGDLPWGLWLALGWCRPHHRSFVFESNAGKNSSRLPLQGEVLELCWNSCPCWLWPALRCLLSCLMGLCKCFRFLPGAFWYPVKDTWWMRNQALKLVIVVWSTECIDSSRLLGTTCGCWQFFVTIFCHFPVLPVCDFDVLFVLRTTTILHLVVPYFPFSLGKPIIFYFQ